MHVHGVYPFTGLDQGTLTQEWVLSIHIAKIYLGVDTCLSFCQYIAYPIPSASINTGHTLNAITSLQCYLIQI